jgi:hypothetical protein
MRLYRCVPAFAAVVSLAGVSAPAAFASDAIAPGGGPLQASTTQVIQRHTPASDDWVIGIGAAGVAVLGAGAVLGTRHRRPLAGTRAAS